MLLYIKLYSKQDLTVKQAYRASFCFALWYEAKYWQLTLVSSAFYRLSLEETSIYATPIYTNKVVHVFKAIQQSFV